MLTYVGFVVAFIGGSALVGEIIARGAEVEYVGAPVEPYRSRDGAWQHRLQLVGWLAVAATGVWLDGPLTWRRTACGCWWSCGVSWSP